MKHAPGHPGNKSTWCPAAKSGVGCAAAPKVRLWFSLGRGVINEAYYPRIDQAAMRDFGFIIAGPDGFLSREQSDCFSDTQLLAEGVPGYRIENTCTQGRYRITKEIIIDPMRDALLQRVKVSALQGSLADLRLYALLSPRLNDHGENNSGWIDSYRAWPMLFAQRNERSLAIANSCGWTKRSVGYVGESDAWEDLKKHGRMTWQYDGADHGHIALAGEIDLQACNGEFIIAVAFNGAPQAAGLNAVLSLNSSFDHQLQQFVREWQQWHKSTANLDDQPDFISQNIEQRQRPDRSRPRVNPKLPGHCANLYRTSMMVLRTHRAKQFNGAGVASLSVPWGEVRGDDDLGGYHLVWARDMVEEVTGLLAGGVHEEIRCTLQYLQATQNPDGGWPQNMWLDGSPYMGGSQLDESALPILLVNLAHRQRALDDAALQSYWPMIRKAAAAICKSGPATQQDRWENTPGLSPYTLATEIAGLLIAARLADQFGDAKPGAFFRQTADLWNDLIESWTYVTGTPLAKSVGVDGYYIRIAPSPGMHTFLRRGQIPLMKQARDLPYTEVVSADALALVRFGLRAPDDPRMLNTVKVIDAITRADLPAGPCWRRYNGGYYGEHEDGSAFTGHGDMLGHGRAWPLLTGERGHYELAAGNTNEAIKLLGVMSGFASQVGLLPEQVWDGVDMPSHDLYRGRPSGSAMPLAWTHSEYIRLLRSIRDGRVFDRPDDAWQRYVQKKTHTELALWRFDHQVGFIPAGRRLRIETGAPAIVHFSFDDWKTAHDLPTQDSGIGLHYVDLPTAQLKLGSRLCFTFRWPEAANKWEGRDFCVQVDAASASPPTGTGRSKSSNRQALVGSHG